MNFDTMPELHIPYAYPGALAIMVVVMWLPYRQFKRTGWL
jgi:magnesium transporter